MRRWVAKLVFWTMAFMRNRYLRARDELQTAQISSKLARCGSQAFFYYPCHVSGAEFMEVGDNVRINRGAFIRAEGTLKIGDNTHIARNVVIYTINHNYFGTALPYDDTMLNKAVVIGRNVWIGINVTIVPGVRIGEGAIVGAGTVVSRDIPPFAIVGSQPPRILKYRDRSHYDELDRLGRYGGPGGKLVAFRSSEEPES
ncbi:acyltransferase [Chloroflexota bacterium]